jgi:DNA-directed RNA polymerase beta' subunit
MSAAKKIQPSRIIGVQFSMLSPEEIRKNSVVEITNRDTYINNKPVIGGLFDPRMGTIDPNIICPTDGMTYIDTPGYFGHIELARPVFFMQHFKEIVKICKCVCFKCSKLLIDKEQHRHILEWDSEARWSYVYDIASKTKRCSFANQDGCGCKQFDRIKVDNMSFIYAIWENVKSGSAAAAAGADAGATAVAENLSMRMTPEIVLKIFKRISDDDIHFMGFSPVFSRPEWFICETLAVPPPAVRPSVKHDANQRSEDDLTQIYITIIKTNNDLKEKIKSNAAAHIIDNIAGYMQFYIANIANNKVKGSATPMTQRSGRPLQCIRDRLDRKHGRIRGNLMGKRVDFSARSVITADPNLSIRELGVPLKVAKNLTKPVVVNDLNRDFLLKLVQNGPEVYPGAKILERRTGENISLMYIDRLSIKLENGDIVHRHLMDGDAVLFNRQPSLHKMSMMCHIVKVMKQGDTFRLHVSVTKPYNADFDGDEMNMHAPQNAAAETELRHLAAVPYQLISPSNNSPIIGIFQDSLLGSFRFTRENLRFSAREAMNLLMMFPRVDPTTLFSRSRDEVTNFEILSQIMPPISLNYKTKLFDEEPGQNKETSNHVLEIRNGQYIRGQMEKGVLGSGTKGILHRTCNDIGNMACSDFIDDLQHIITEYMKASSYSVGIGDLIADSTTQTKIAEIITEQKREVQTLIDRVHLGIFENKTAATNMVEFEKQVNSILNKAAEQSGKIGRNNLNPNNRFVTIVKCGSKGSTLNISQMISCLGQQNVDGKRIPYGFDNRTLPHFAKFDDSPGARGFIENSYIKGLTAPQLFFHAMGGRIGLIDTACKSVTWETPIVIIENDKPIYTEIGRWIDGKLSAAEPEKIKHFEEKNMELLDLTEVVYIPTTDQRGNITWGELTAVTRHDPGERLYEVTTYGGRKVTVAESRSLLIWNAEKQEFCETNSPDAKVGDYMPVTVELCEPPIIVNSVDVSEYLPKNKYIYGTEFNKAKELMLSAMKDRKKIPTGWWKQNNGTLFTLPYTKKSLLQRAIVRSDIENIKDGCVYPYNAKRIDAIVDEKFELNEENGIFIGLFLADGNIHDQHIIITKNNENIRTFVKEWYKKHSIGFTERIRSIKDKKINGTSNSIVATNSILATFLKKFVGNYSQSKYVPNEAFIAPEPFIIGLLNGYFSGDGWISKSGCVYASSVSKRLTEGICMLCSRIGIFGKVNKIINKPNNASSNPMPSYSISINAQWAQIFSNKITLLENNKNYRLKNNTHNNIHKNFTQKNNVVLDKIVEINVIGVEKHPKLYDVTVPSTLNFGIANGLNVVDTSQTGYIQRRLIKGLEDLKMEYDMTVRNSKGKIIQFVYGDDGIETTRIESQVLPLGGMNIQDIYSLYDIPTDPKIINLIYTKTAASRFNAQQGELKEKCSDYIKRALQAREDVVMRVFSGKSDNSVKAPVAFPYIIANVQGQMNLGANTLVDITPLEAFQLIENNMRVLNKIKYAQPTALFQILYNYYLNPKDLVVNKRFHRKALVLLLEQINLNYKRSLVHPGEMVGVIAGQSIGEPTTQMTLNSVTYETEILVRDSNMRMHKYQIGDFVTQHMKKSKKVEYYDEKDTTYAELDAAEEYFEIPSSNEDGETVWNRIEAVTQHPVVNRDGTNTMLKITTENCHEVTVTKAKSVLKLINGKIGEADGETLKLGDYLIISRRPLEYAENTLLNIRDVLPPTEYIYGSEMEKARAVVREHQWWKNHSGTTFVIPYNRSDSAYSALTPDIARFRTPITIDYKSGFIYTKKAGVCGADGHSDGSLPETIELDYDFGYLVGAYAAEGCMTKHQISIANNEPEYFEPILRLCKKLNITTKHYVHKDKIKEGWTSSDIRIYNTLMCRILENLCGKLSHNKFVSPDIVYSNKECIYGFLDAYIGGDGCVNKGLNEINAHSVSLKMLLDIQQMTRNIGIVGIITKEKKQETNNRGTLPENIHQPYKIRFRQNQCKKLSHILNVKIPMKIERIQSIREKYFKYEVSEINDLVFPNEIDGNIVWEARNGRMSDLMFDRIVSIEEVPNTTNYAYDLTVENTRNFDTYYAVVLRDTFHFSGVASKSNVTRGVPRIEEILRLTKNPKNPSMNVFLRAEDQFDKEKATKYTHILEHTKLGDLVKSMQIYFDPDDHETTILDDKVWLEQYYDFEKMLNNCGGQVLDRDTPKSRWIIRMEMDAEEMLDKNITMDDIHYCIVSYSQNINCAYTDYNADNLVFRLRLSSDLLSKPKKKVGGSTSAAPLDQTDELYMLNNFQETVLNQIVLRGISGITKVMPFKLQGYVTYEEDKYVTKDRWVLDTTGSNLLETLALDFIDPTQTYSNDIKEIHNILGIEATRQIIYNELVEVIEFSGAYVNSHHLQLLADRMTNTISLVPIYRSGILYDDIGPIAKATFEVHTEEFLTAARHGALDHMRGISANVMTGQNGYYGTSAFQVVLDMDKLVDGTGAPPPTQKSALDAMLEDFERLDMYSGCAREKIGIKNNIKNIVPAAAAAAAVDCDDNDIGF